MKEVKATIKDRTTLILNEDANKGDYIDLSKLTDIDSNLIIDAINKGTDKIYNQKLQEVKNSLNKDYMLKSESINKDYQNKLLEVKQSYIKEINELNNKLSLSDKNKELALKDKEVELNKEIDLLKNQNKSLNDNLNNQIKLKISEVELKYINEINKLKETINGLHNELELTIAKKKLDESNLKMELNNKHIEELKLKEEELNKANQEINILQRAKSSINVKLIGEDLEGWCNNEVQSYMQNGFSNCIWYKDNESITLDGESKGSKADFIFKIFASNNKLDEELLATVVLEMKDENPESINKQTNAHYYKALDKNRMKKNGTYAILVSNLERDKSNDNPMYKVSEYENMYVVRPEYMMTLLNILTSLHTKFSSLLLEKNKNELEIKSKLDLIDEFNSIKNTYLDKPLELLKDNLDKLTKSNGAIIKASEDINKTIEKIKISYVEEIEKKINNFDLKLNKEIRKYEKLTGEEL